MAYDEEHAKELTRVMHKDKEDLVIEDCFDMTQVEGIHFSDELLEEELGLEEEEEEDTTCTKH